jgi:hypothetical protein
MPGCRSAGAHPFRRLPGPALERVIERTWVAMAGSHAISQIGSVATSSLRRLRECQLPGAMPPGVVGKSLRRGWSEIALIAKARVDEIWLVRAIFWLRSSRPAGLRGSNGSAAAPSTLIRSEAFSMSNESRLKTLEQQIVRSYIWLLRAPENIDGLRVSVLSRHGEYDVRLVEPLQMKRSDILPFWIELYDRTRKVSLDSYGGDDIEQAAAMAEVLIVKAEVLNGEAE